MDKLSLISPPQTENKHEIPSKPQLPSLRVLQILQKSLQITGSNITVGASILLPVFIFSFLLSCGAELALVPVSKVVKAAILNLDNEANQRGFFKDIRKLLVILLVYFLFSFAIWIWFSVTAISFSSGTLNGKLVNTIDLFLRAGERWKKPVITGFYMALISLSLTLLFVLSIGLVSIFTEGPVFVALLCAICISILLSYLYWAAVWMLSLVCSVLEDGSCGFKSIERARELIRGKRVKGCALNLIFVMIIRGIISVTSSSLTGMIKGDMKGLMGVSMPTIFLICLVDFFIFVGYTVFYHECRKSCEENAFEGELGLYDCVPIGSAGTFSKI
ncbi:hypothetical protein NMG60_11005777 [Bertholletia excelsa]